MVVRTLLATLLLCAAIPAHAADLSTIGCLGERLDVGAMQKITADTERGMTQPGAILPDPLVTAAVRSAAQACAKEHGWPPAALRPATSYVRAKLGWPVAQRLAAERGLDPAVLEGVWLTLPEEQRNAPLTNQAYRELADAAIPEGEQRTEAMGRFIRRFFELLSVIQSSSYEFAQA